MSESRRIFCTKLSGLCLRILLERLREAGQSVHFVESSLEHDLESPLWSRTQIVCADTATPVTLEHYIAGIHSTMVEDEVVRFTEYVSSLGESMGKREVLVYLRMTRELFIMRIPDRRGREMDQAIEACGELLTEIGEGILLVDGDGFYKEGEMLLGLPGE